jgi:hypothetical protein
LKRKRTGNVFQLPVCEGSLNARLQRLIFDRAQEDPRGIENEQMK